MATEGAVHHGEYYSWMTMAEELLGRTLAAPDYK